MDFDNEPLENILDAINSLRNDIKNLAIIIFKAESNDAKVLRIGSKIPGAVYSEYSRKKDVFNKLIANKNIASLLKTYLSTKNEQTSNKGAFRK